MVYNVNCWLCCFDWEQQADAAGLRPTTLATSRSASCSWLPRSGDTSAAPVVRSSDHDESLPEEDRFTRLRTERKH